MLPRHERKFQNTWCFRHNLFLSLFFLNKNTITDEYKTKISEGRILWDFFSEHTTKRAARMLLESKLFFSYFLHNHASCFQKKKITQRP